jgi:ADP-ribose pyrophosphatase
MLPLFEIPQLRRNRDDNQNSEKIRLDMKPDKTLSSKIVFEGRAVKLRVDTIQMPDGRQTTREIVEHGACIAVIAIDRDDKVLLVSQYRGAVGKELLEIPAGGVDPGEDVETAAKREMQEETGYLPQKLVKLGGYYLAPGYSTEYLHLYLAEDLITSRLVAEDTEGITVVRVPVSQIRKLLNSGKICDGKSIAGLYTFLEYRKKH